MNASNVTGFDEFDDDGNDRRERDNIEQTLDILSYSNSETSSSFNVKDGRSSSVVDESTRARLHAPSIKKQDIDESSDSENELDGAKVAKRTPHEAPLPFPQKLMEILSTPEYNNMISWLPHGNGFVIRNKKSFTAEVMPKYFKKSKFTSFTRKLNRWNFTRVSRGPESGAYYNPLFQRGHSKLAVQMTCLASTAPQNMQSLHTYSSGMGHGVSDPNNAVSRGIAGNSMNQPVHSNIENRSNAPNQLQSEQELMHQQQQEVQQLHQKQFHQQQELLQHQQQQQQQHQQQQQQQQERQHDQQQQHASITMMLQQLQQQQKNQQQPQQQQQQQQQQSQQQQQQLMQLNQQTLQQSQKPGQGYALETNQMGNQKPYSTSPNQVSQQQQQFVLVQPNQTMQQHAADMMVNTINQHHQHYSAMFLSQQQQLSAMNAAMGMQLQSQQQQMTFLQNQNANLIANQNSHESQKQELDYLRTQNQQLLAQQGVQKSQQDQLDFLMNQNLLMQDLHQQQMNLMRDEKVAQQQIQEIHHRELESIKKRSDSQSLDSKSGGSKSSEQQSRELTDDLKQPKVQLQESQQDQRIDHLTYQNQNMLTHQVEEESNRLHRNVQTSPHSPQSMTEQALAQSQNLSAREPKQEHETTANDESTINSGLTETG